MLRLKNAETPEFQKAYNRIDEFFRKIILLGGHRGGDHRIPPDVWYFWWDER